MQRPNTVIPGRREATNPESGEHRSFRAAGFRIAANAVSGMTIECILTTC
jgi:hypothetical protein